MIPTPLPLISLKKIQEVNYPSGRYDSSHLFSREKLVQEIWRNKDRSIRISIQVPVTMSLAKEKVFFATFFLKRK